MHFVDKASPQQLKAMVDTQSPYSFMALAKLQQIRDAAMRQKAYEPTPPPLSQQIPQELAKGEAPAASQMPMGIAAMGGAPQMPMMPPQQAAPQAGVGPQMSPSAAGGGLVAFKDGGGIKGFANPPYLVEDPDTTPLERSYLSLGRGVERFLTEPQSEEARLYEKRGKIANQLQSQFGPQAGFPGLFMTQTDAERDRAKQILKFVNDPKTPMFAVESLAKDPSRFEVVKNSLANNSRGTTTPTPAYADSQAYEDATSISGATNPATTNQARPNAQAGNAAADTSGRSVQDIIRSASAAAGSSIPTSMPGLADAVKMTKEGYKGLASGREQERKVLAAQMRDPEAEAEQRALLLGTPEQRNAEVSAQMKVLNESIPDQNKRIATELEKLRGEVSKSEEMAPYQSLLKVAVGLMGTNKTNLFQAVGEAGGAGLEEYNKAQAAIKAQKNALLSADANLASAQEARQRGLSAQAQQFVDQSRRDKLEAYNQKRSAEVYNGEIAIRIAGSKTEDSQQKINQAVQLFGFSSAAADYNIKRQNLMNQFTEIGLKGQALENALIPDAAKAIDWLKKNPDKAPDFERHEDRVAALGELAKAITTLDNRQKTAENNGMLRTDPRFPSTENDVEDIIKSVTTIRKRMGLNRGNMP